MLATTLFNTKRYYEDTNMFAGQLNSIWPKIVKSIRPKILKSPVSTGSFFFRKELSETKELLQKQQIYEYVPRTIGYTQP